MPVLLNVPFSQFFDSNGSPLSGGKLYTYEAGTTTPKATFTDEAGTTQAANPIILDSAGRATIWISGTYKFRLEDSSDTLVEETDDVTAFTTSGSSTLGDDTVTLAKQAHGTQGGVIYYGAAGAPTELAAGTSGQVLQTQGAGANPQWANAAAGLVFLSSATASASTSLDFSSSIDSTYDDYVFILKDIIPATDGADLYLRTSTDGGSTYDSTANDYTYAFRNLFDNNAANLFSTTATALLIGDGVGNASGESLSGVIHMLSPAGTTNTKFLVNTAYGYDASTNLAEIHGAGQRAAAEDVDAVRFVMSSGNITSGVIYMYGVVKS